MRQFLTPLALITSIALPITSFAMPPEEAKQYLNKPGIHKVLPAPKVAADAETRRTTKHDRYAQQMQQELKLSDEQVKQLQAVREASRQERRAIQDKYLPEVKRKAMHAEFKSSAEKQQQKMQEILTPEQRKQWSELKQKHRSTMKKHHKGIHKPERKHKSDSAEPRMHRS
ncbi:Spy/CpxP family protein refolding chaperone [Thiopseudomonas alkaliphila]|uniref:Spy/CpxP family protein refolding chaperone n=1 Tax=Thiopseudomonas alkaliphila TaxID=1697053 RepID=UPI00257802A8|nr:hypothetical protein [Thiopseudomonas alkaliphila]MDM1715740.1 hypothetical protein [Thiopseudomonas alkaliphila]